MSKTYPYYLAGEAVYANTDLKVTDKYSGEVAYEVPLATPDVLDEAIAAAEGAAEAMRKMTVYERQAVLEHCVKRFTERADELAEALCIEAGKPINDAKGEVGRLIDTFKIAAEETPRMLGETLPLDISPRAKGYRGMTQRVPIGPCAFISPFNFPLNLAAHKVAPAIAAGCPFVLKPASMTPIGALVIGEILAETDLPKGAFSILPCRRDSADMLTEDDRLKLLSFTGSPEVGWALKARAGKKPVVLELGGNAACVVDNDWDLDDAVARVIIGAFYQSGQSCIGVQRLYVHSDVYDTFKEKLLTKTKALKSGDPKDPETFIGPMISEGEAERLHGWIKDALDRGATLLCGGERDGNMLQASLLENVPADCELSAEEAFGPVAILEPFDDYDAVLKKVNDSRYGLQAGIFTRDLYKAQKAWDELEVGGVVIGDVPSWRVDHMPYGGVKDSGIGREGIRYALEDMTELRLMVVRTPQ
ncbi:MAG: aldehyde dehydrogenase family protein [Thalassolituus maritimus]|nr:aldehyde dehydrogenase [Oleibacter sp. HI0075]MDQ4424020.1 aldehyde dehydrogenase family protein [Thalassolituus sp.]MEC8909254.1 aldehyde dehydrogenase family protein [Pseudomonadota bacterium]TPD54571.1 MAG: aldehyde dehydrogenase family protein [Thalassolituus maritimus]MEC9409207.1 aldehyde dehydrogenase family protein [Pseudomonadota bacterium]|tara:strand:- start:42 stop:1469 length:1428 start_codon:yes stop_codon:yes gene_type:complete